jgi:DNA-binding NtrC family response regulator
MPRRVLIVDDDRHMVQTLSDIFTARGWEVDGVYSGMEAIQAVAHREYSVVLMDVKMPLMSGVDALRAMKASDKRTPVVLMTAYAGRDVIAQAMRDGALRVLSKPIAVGEVLEFLDQHLTSGCVLVVDDDPVFLSTAADVLRAHGYRVDVASGLDDAIRLLSAREHRVVLLDLRLGGARPTEAIDAVHRADPAARLILCSGYPELLHEATRVVPAEWIRGTLQKPFSPDRLLDLIDAV